MRLLAWVLRAALFLLLFGLALNNQHEVVVHGLFGTQWRAPMIVVVLASFVAGVALALVALGVRRWPGAGRRVLGRGTDGATASPPRSSTTTPGTARPATGQTLTSPTPQEAADALALGAADGPPRDGR